jgi:hypothetical protein
MDWLVAERTHLGGIAAICQVDGAHTCYFLAGAHASAAEDAFVVVAVKSGVALIYRENSRALAHSIEVLLLDAQISRHLLQFALLILGAGKAVTNVVSHD